MKKLIFLMALITSLTAMAQRGPMGNQRLQLHLDRHVMGNQTIMLKSLLQQSHPYLNLQQMDLKAVVVLAKSQNGMGTVGLKVGASLSYAETIPGSPWQFQNNLLSSFSKIRITSPSYTDLGVWQLLTHGNIKIKKVIVVVAPKQVIHVPAPRPVRVVRPAPAPRRVIVRPAPRRTTVRVAPAPARPAPRARARGATVRVRP